MCHPPLSGACQGTHQCMPSSHQSSSATAVHRVTSGPPGIIRLLLSGDLPLPCSQDTCLGPGTHHQVTGCVTQPRSQPITAFGDLATEVGVRLKSHQSGPITSEPGAWASVIGGDPSFPSG